MSLIFEVDPRIDAMYEALSLDCVNLARSNFGMELDVSEESIRQIEAMAAMLHDQMPPGGVPPETVMEFAGVLGGHVAHVMITFRGGAGGMASIGTERIPAVRLEGDQVVWPWGKAHNRLLNGPEDNIWHYYQMTFGELVSWS